VFSVETTDFYRVIYREIIAIGVIARDLAIIVCDMPGISLVITSRVA